MKEYSLKDAVKISGAHTQNVNRWVMNGFIKDQPKVMGSGRPRVFDADQIVAICAISDYHQAVGAGMDELKEVAAIIQKPRVRNWGGVVFFYRKHGEPVLVEQKSPFVPRPGEALVGVRNHLAEEWYK